MKNKTKISLLSGLAVVSAIVPALTTVSCGNSQVKNKIGEEYDKEYGVDEACYTKLKVQFENDVAAKVWKETENEEEVRKAVSSVKSACKTFDKKFNERGDLSYTVITSSLIEYAARTYNIKLTRKTSTKTADWAELDEAYNGMSDSMDSYMNSIHILPADRQAILRSARYDYNNRLKPQYVSNYHDVLSGITRAKADLLTCFADVNEEIGLVAASTRLKDFLSTHKVEYDFYQKDQENKLDVLEAKYGNTWFKEGADLSVDSHILKIFNITREGETKPMTEFDAKKVCPGYTVRPILKRVNKNAKTNEYSLDIDWTCYKSSYEEQGDFERVERTTAHFYRPKNLPSPTSLMSGKEIYEALKDTNENSYISYPIYLTKKGETQALLNTYFNKDATPHLELYWDSDATKNAFDALFSGTKFDAPANGAEFEYKIGNDALAKAGLKIKCIGTPNAGETITDGRLSDFIGSRGATETSSDALFSAASIINDFVENCSVWADVQPKKEPTGSINGASLYSSKNAVYVDYRNTQYGPIDSVDGTVVSYNAIEADDFKNLFTVSQDAYDYLTSSFNSEMDFYEIYKTNQFKEQYDEVEDEVVMESIMFSLTVLFTAQIVAFCFVPVFAAHIPVYIVLLALAIISLGGQAAILGLLVDKKLKPLEKFKNNCEDIKNDSNLNWIIDKLNETKGDNALCRYDEDKEIDRQAYNDGFIVFQGKDFFADTLPAMTFYQTLDRSEQALQFRNLLKAKDITPEKYGEKMDVWDPKGACQIASYVLMGTTFAIDIATLFMMGSLPEMTDWTLMKKAAADARATGKSTKEMVRTYKMLEEMKKNVAKMAKELRALQKDVADISKITASEGRELEASGKIETLGGKFASANEKIKAMIPGFEKIVKELSESSEAIQTTAKQMLEWIKQGQYGFTAMLKAAAIGAKSGEITKPGAVLITEVTKGLAAAVDIVGRDAELIRYANDLQYFDDFVKFILKGGPEGEVMFELRKIAASAQFAARNGAVTEALEWIQKFEQTILDEANWVTDFADIAIDCNQTASELGYMMKGFRQIISAAWDRVVGQLKLIPGFILN